jgi:hypothetical protein
MASLCDLVPPGVVTGDDLMTLLEHARTNGYAIPAVNCTRYVPKNLRSVGYPHQNICHTLFGYLQIGYQKIFLGSASSVDPLWPLIWSSL